MSGVLRSIRLVAALAAALTAAPASAETLSLSPSADGSPMLRLAPWRGGAWQVRNANGQVLIAFPDAPFKIVQDDLATPAFADALLSVVSTSADDAAELRLDLGCTCRVAVFDDGSGLVIEILGGAIAPAGGVWARMPAPQWAGPPPSRDAAQGEKGRSTSGLGVGGVLEEPDVPETLRVARDQLVAQLERAAAAGLIDFEDPAHRAVPHPPGRDSEENSPQRRHVRPQPVEPARAITLQAGERRGSSGARGSAPRVTQAEAMPAAGHEGEPPEEKWTPPATPISCQPDAVFALPDPETQPPFAGGLGAIRRRLVREFDEVDPAAADANARHYLANGFGWEAASLVRAFLSADEPGRALVAMAGVLEGPPTESVPLSARDCVGAHALWSALAEARLGTGDWLGRSDDAVALGLQTLPRSLRRDAAARLGLAASEAGDWDMAERFAALARRASVRSELPTGAQTRLEAKLSARRGAAHDAMAMLKRQARAHNEMGLAAEIDLAELLLAPQPSDAAEGLLGDTRNLRLDLASSARLMRGTATGSRAAIAVARLTARDLGRQAGIDRLAEARGAGLVTEADYASAMTEIAGAPDKSPEDTPLAILHQQSPERYAPALAEPSVRRALARSYAEIGLPARALGFLQETDFADASLTTALTEAFLDADAPERAAEMAAQLPPGANRQRLLARSLMALGAPDQALAVLEAHTGAASSAGADPELRARAAWQAREWTRAATALAEQQADASSPRADAALRLLHARDMAASGAVQAPPSGAVPKDFIPSAEGVGRYLASIEEELKMAREILDDG